MKISMNNASVTASGNNKMAYSLSTPFKSNKKLEIGSYQHKTATGNLKLEREFHKNYRYSINLESKNNRDINELYTLVKTGKIKPTTIDRYA